MAGYTILNDIHLGVKRQGGTTPQTQDQLRDYLQGSFAEFLKAHADQDLIIAGDLFDAFEVDSRDVLACYYTLASFLENDARRVLTLIAGNHDYSPRGDKLSSFHLLASLLDDRYSSKRFGGRFQLIDKGLAEIANGLWAIPHMPNQDLFDMELEAALHLNPEDISALVNPMKVLLLHANYDNKFTVNSDHSLNVTREQAQAFAAQGVRLLFAHEHQAGSDLDGYVRILGNQWPSSIADCLNNEQKFSHTVSAGGLEKGDVTWDRLEANRYMEIDWKVLPWAVGSGQSFIRVTGAALASEAEAVIETISKYRAASPAFVVANAVKVEGMAEMNAMGEVSAESIRAFDVMAALLSELSEPEQEVVRGLI